MLTDLLFASLLPKIGVSCATVTRITVSEKSATEDAYKIQESERLHSKVVGETTALLA